MKTLLDLKTAVERWTNKRFTFDSNYYAGRGVSLSDLNSAILEKIYDGLKADVGEKAAKNFVRFINNLKDLRAAAFIEAFEQFSRSGCEQVGISKAAQTDKRDAVYGDSRDALAVALVGSAFMYGKNSLEQIEEASLDIKSEFLDRHRAEI